MTLTRRQLYMLPTRYGLWFALVLLVMLLAGINYQNGLVHALTFLLAAVGLVSMLYTHRNLMRLEIEPGNCAPVFVGETACFGISLRNPSSYARAGVDVGQKRKVLQSVDLAPFGDAGVTLELPATRRGFLDAPPFRVSTRYPFGLFYSWSRNLSLPARCLVYPKPGPAKPLPLSPTQSGQRAGARQGDDDFAGLREYVIGDAPGHVHWKATARGQGLLTKQFAGAQSGPVWLDWDAAHEGDAETRLSQLCRWALEAERLGLHFGLRIPGARVPLGQGPTHLARCLEALALF